MPHVKQHLFGPGSLEMLRLDLWSSKVEPQLEGEVSRQFRSKLVGQYDVYCGNGGEHRIHIKVEGSAWSSEAGSYAVDLCKARAGDFDAAERFTRTLIEMELEDWSDPCEDVNSRLEYLREQIQAESISMSELIELQGMADSIDPSDVELLEWAGVPEFEED